MYSLATLGTTKAFVLKVELFCQVRSLVRQFLSVYVLCSKLAVSWLRPSEGIQEVRRLGEVYISLEGTEEQIV